MNPWQFPTPSLLAHAIRLSSLLLVAGAAQAASAAEAPAVPAEGPVLDEIVVTSDRLESFSADYVQAGTFRDARVLDTPLTVNIMTKELLDAQQALTIADATRNSPGVTSHQINSTIYSNLAIRGIPTGATTNFRLNGVLPIVNRIDMPLENKERVEVLKGASGLYYGFASPSGIVNLVTKRASMDVLSVSAFGNDHGGIGGSVDAGKVWGVHGVRVNAALSSIETGIDETEGERYFGSIAYDWKPNDEFSFLFDAEYIDKEVTEPSLIVLPAAVDNVITLPPLQDPSTNFGDKWFKAEADAYNILGRIQYDFSPQWSARLSVGHAYLDTLRRFSSLSAIDYASGNGTLSVSTFPENTFERNFYRADIAGVFRTGPLEHEILFGASRDEIDIQTPVGVPQGRTTQNLYNPTADLPSQPEPPLQVRNKNETTEEGLYATNRTIVTDWLEFTLGARFTDYRNESWTSVIDTSPDTYSGSVMVKPRDWVTVYASYIEGLEEGGIAPGIANNPGEVLPAALSEQWEAGVKVEPMRGFLLTVAGFQIERETAYLNSANFFVLDGEGKYQGIEFGASGELSENLSLTATGTWIDAEQESGPDAIVGNQIENTPEYSGSLFVEYAIPQVPGLRINAGVFYMDERAVNAANQAFAADYTLVDIGASYETALDGHALIFRLNGHNVTDEEHWEATGSGLIQQGPPPVIRFSVTASL